MSIWVRAGRILLCDMAFRRIRDRYRWLRRDREAGRLAATLHCMMWMLAWALLRLESPAWRRLRQRPSLARLHEARPRPGDVLRYPLQLLGSLLLYPRTIGLDGNARARHSTREPRGWRPPAAVPSLHRKLRSHIGEWIRRRENIDTPRPSFKAYPALDRIAKALVVGLTATLVLLVITQPFDLMAQGIFTLLMLGAVLLVRRLPGRLVTLTLIALSVTISSRYLWWRYTETLNWNNALDIACGLLLLAAETYVWVTLMLGYFQSLWPLHRQPIALPDDAREWPCVDLMIPTYNESLEVVRPSVLAALGLDWPRDRLRIHLLDDGNRASFREFAAAVGIHYIARQDNRHAKAGNLNHAMTLTEAEFVAIFDCDHLPQRSFLQLTLGWFLREPRLGLLQTPHHFFSPDPFERNLGRFRRTPNEGTLFYGLLQDGNDLWDASFFCGSCAVLRRRAIEDIGGFATQTVTEDAHTSLRLHRHGYTSAYLRIPQAAGLATESLAAHIAQRIRWARGMIQIFRLDNPLLGQGLSLSQRLCYANAMLHFLAGVPRLIFLTAPLAFLFFHAYIIYAPALAILLYAIPHMLHANLTNSRLQGCYRHTFWSEIYDTVLAWYIARPTTAALLNPFKGRFNVTIKGGHIPTGYFDWTISRPYLLLVMLNTVGLLAGALRLWQGPADEAPTVLISLAWTLYNLMILGGAIAVATEARQVRQAHRVQVDLPAGLELPDGYLYPCRLMDYSDTGASIVLPQADLVPPGTAVNLLLTRGRQERAFAARVARRDGDRLGLHLAPMPLQDQIDYIQYTFARADNWAVWQDRFPEDRPLQSFGDVFLLSLGGYRSLGQHLPLPLRRSIAWLASFLPHRDGLTAPPYQSIQGFRG